MHPFNAVLENLADAGLYGPNITTFRNFPKFEIFLTLMGGMKVVRDAGTWQWQFKTFDDYCRTKYGLSEKAVNFSIAIGEQADQMTN